MTRAGKIMGMGSVVRLRSVDTNPIKVPSRYWADDWATQRATDADRFAKQATVITELYSTYLDSGAPLRARTSWVRFVPNNSRGPRRFTGIPSTQDLGNGEVHEVPFDPAVVYLPDDQRRKALLDWLHDNMLALADSLGWEAEPLVAARDACLRAECRFTGAGQPKADPRRTKKAHIEYEIDGNGDGWTWVVVTDANGDRLVVSKTFDGVPARVALRRATKTLRWDGHSVTWTPWASRFIPHQHPELVHPQRLTLPQ